MMNVDLTDDLSRFIDEQLNAGYVDRNEVVRDALRLLRTRTTKLARLRALIDEGRADFEVGRTKRLTDALLRDVAEGARRAAETLRGRAPSE